MYNTYIIKMKLFRKLDINKIIELTNLNYGILSRKFILTPNQTGKYTVLFNKEKTGTGLEFHIEKNKIQIVTYYIQTKFEINLLYQTIKTICNYLNTNTFLRNDKKSNINEIDNYIKEDIKESEKNLQSITQKLYFTDLDNIFIIGVHNPIYLGKDEIDQIDNDLDKYENLLHKIQHGSFVYPESSILINNDTKEKISVTFLFMYDRNAITETPFYYGVDTSDVKEYYACIDGTNYIKYKDLFKQVNKKNKIDDQTYMLVIDDSNIKKILNNKCYNIQSKEKIDPIYYGELIDYGDGHWEKIIEKNLNTEGLNSLNHIAIFMKYAYLNNKLDQNFLKENPNIKTVIETNQDLRKEINQNPIIRGNIRIEYFTKEFQSFVKYYYNFENEDHNCYPFIIDTYALEYFGQEKYNSEEFQNEAYLFVPYTDEYYEIVSEIIDDAYKNYVKSHKKEK